MSGRLMIALRGNLQLAADDLPRLRSRAVGGVILFARNFANSAQLRRLCAAIRVACAPRKILIAADQEGGRVQRFAADGFCALPSMAALAASAEPEKNARRAGLVLAAELLAHGLDLAFAPVLDLAHGNSRVIGSRAFCANGGRAAALALAFASGMKQGGSAACGKHFPGHGHAKADSHIALPQDRRALPALRKADLLPFAAFARAGGALVMTAHIVYPKVDAKNAAGFSAAWIKKVLRGQLNYKGLVTCDDLSMAAAANGGATMRERLQAARAAGCDLQMVCGVADLDAAVAAADKRGAAGGGWAQLSRASQPRVCVGDSQYAQARAALIRQKLAR